MRRIGLAVAVGLSILAARTALTPPPACLLLTAPDVQKLVGFPVVVDPNDKARMDFHCLYNKPGSYEGAEITWRAFADAQTAHAAFPRWVIPVPPTPASMTLTTVKGVGDTATLVYSPVGHGIYFQKGAVLVKVGTIPPASDSALKTAGILMASRL